MHAWGTDLAEHRTESKQEMTPLRTILAVTIGLAFLTVERAASTEPANDQATLQTKRDENAIRQIIANWDQGWRVFDPELTTRGYASDADWTNAFGISRKGQLEIHKFLADLYKNPGIRSRQSTPSTTTIRFIRPDIATATSYRETVGQKSASGAAYPTRKTHDLRVLVRDKGTWAIASHLIMDEKESRP
jgi:uncharacterized protein (TIGR02246 family)